MANNLCGASAFTADQTSREPEVYGAAASLRYSTDDLEGALTSLVERLDPVLSPVGPTSSGDAKSLGYSCPLAEQIQIQARRLQGLTAAIREYTSRLEI